jgi:hypothetical protein
VFTIEEDESTVTVGLIGRKRGEQGATIRFINKFKTLQPGHQGVKKLSARIIPVEFALRRSESEVKPIPALLKSRGFRFQSPVETNVGRTGKRASFERK